MENEKKKEMEGMEVLDGIFFLSWNVMEKTMEDDGIATMFEMIPFRENWNFTGVEQRCNDENALLHCGIRNDVIDEERIKKR